MAKTAPFDLYINDYEKWFVDYKYIFLSELEAIKQLLPPPGRGIEVGIGSGLFASKLGIKEGCDPSSTMRKLAESRGLKAIEGIAEDLPYSTNSMDYILMVTTICFVDDIEKTFEEAYRVLKNDGAFIIAFVDKNSPVGKIYEKEKEQNIFYKDATFYSKQDLNNRLQTHNFTVETTLQTVFGDISNIREIQKPQEGHGSGSFVVIKSIKK